ncbi:MAG: polysaccharide deacetylase family protein [Clostridia bacterium]|nr:polysaccharide deacetylase family protein [Clostridia bacterium]
MKRKKKKSRINLVLILLFILLAFLIYKGVKTMQKKDTSDSEKTEVENVADTSESNEDENDSKPTRDLNHLSNTEASFGEIDKPLYKKGEKELKLPIIIYHEFETPVPEDDIYKLYSTEARFEENVTTLLDAGYTFITLEDLYKYDQGYIGLPEKNVIITIDDGAIGCYTEAFNVAKKYNVPMTIFVVENLVGTDHYFSWEAAKEMYDTGLVKIHVHGQQHINATDYSTNEQLVAAYNHAQQSIEENLGENNIMKIMAYPAGKSSANTISALKQAGFEIQVQTRYGTVNRSSTLDLTNLGRVRGEQASGASLLSAFGD